MAKKSNGKAKSAASPAEIEYVPMSEAKLHRRYKAKVVEECLTQIVQRDGAVTRESLLTAATAADHPLHAYFEWDDGVAGHKYRLAQATCMIMATKYAARLRDDREGRRSDEAIEDGRKAVRLRRLLPYAQQEGFGDRPTVLSDAESRRAIVERKLGVLRSWCESVIDISELQSVRHSVLAALDV